MSKLTHTQLEQVPDLVRRLYSLVAEFDALFDGHGRKFTPDGHLVGSIGEVIAAYRYNLTLQPPSTKGYDATAEDGRRVEIKATQGKSVALRHLPDHLLVLQLSSDGLDKEVFNGPGSVVWERCGDLQSNGQRQISLSRLRELMNAVPPDQQLPRRDSV